MSEHNRAERGREPSEGDELLSVTEMAKLAQTSFVSMRRLLEQGLGPQYIDLREGLPAPRAYRVRLADFENWMEGRRRVLGGYPARRP